ncbi:MAG: P-II family nitrogen regulator [Anaerolineales bacterium]
MYLVTLVLHDPDLLEELLDAWTKAGVEGATVLFSSGMGRFRQKQGMRDDLPLIPSLDDFYEAPQTLNRTVFTVVNDDAMVDKILDVTQKLVGDLSQPDTGVMIVTPVARAYGLDPTDKK